MDFALERQPLQYDLRRYLAAIDRVLTAEAYRVETKPNQQHVVHCAFVRFRGLTHQLGISPHETEVLAIKLEIDTNPPQGAQLDTSLVQRHVAVHLQHHDRASLFAGKLHVVLQREHVKGRDWYDLYWYLSQKQWPAPNLDMLNSALGQCGWARGVITADNWRSRVHDRLDQLDWDRVVQDVQRFLIEQQELSGFQKETLENLLIG